MNSISCVLIPACECVKRRKRARSAAQNSIAVSPQIVYLGRVQPQSFSWYYYQAKTVPKKERDGRILNKTMYATTWKKKKKCYWRRRLLGFLSFYGRNDHLLWNQLRECNTNFQSNNNSPFERKCMVKFAGCERVPHPCYAATND